MSKLSQTDEKTPVDATDKRILFALDRDSRQPVSSIAKELRLSKNVVSYRIGNMAKTGIIKGFYSVIDTTMLGFEGYRIYLKWQYLRPEKENEIMVFLANSDLTWWVGRIEAEWDIGILLWVKGAYELSEFWLAFMQKYQEFVIKYSVSVYTKVHDFSYAFLSGKERPGKEVLEVGSAKIAEVNGVQEKILKTVSGNARMPTVEIAEKLGFTPMVVKYNLKKLREEGIIKGFRVMLNLEALGYIYYKINFWLKDRSRYEEILEYAKTHPNVIYVNETIGFADFEAELLVQKHSEFQEILEEMKSIFGDTIREHNYFIYKKIDKIKYY